LRRSRPIFEDFTNLPCKLHGRERLLQEGLSFFQHPGPDGLRPGVLAVRTSASKQAMNHLLHQLEEGGYITRESHPDDRRTRVVRLTDRGWAAIGVIRETMARLEQHWAEELGPELYAGLAHALLRLEQVLDDEVSANR